MNWQRLTILSRNMRYDTLVDTSHQRSEACVDGVLFAVDDVINSVDSCRWIGTAFDVVVHLLSMQPRKRRNTDTQ